MDGSKIAQGVIGLSGKHSLGGGFLKQTGDPDWLADAAEVVNNEGNDEEKVRCGCLSKVASDRTVVFFLRIFVHLFAFVGTFYLLDLSSLDLSLLNLSLLDLSPFRRRHRHGQTSSFHHVSGVRV